MIKSFFISILLGSILCPTLLGMETGNYIIDDDYTEEDYTDDKIIDPTIDDIEKDDSSDEIIEIEIDEDDPFEVGKMYYLGFFVPQDYEKAMKYFLEAAEKGHPEAQFTIGLMYLLSQGVKQDFKEAFKWFLKAAKRNHKGASGLVDQMKKDALV